jgi:hypothetical protein
MNAFKVGDKVKIAGLPEIGTITAINTTPYEVEYHGASYEIISRNFAEDDLAIADVSERVGQQNLQAAESEMA